MSDEIDDDGPVLLPITEGSLFEKVPIVSRCRAIASIIERHIESPLPLEQINNPQIFASYIEPVIYDIEKQYVDGGTMFVLLATRVHFLDLVNHGKPSEARLISTRAAVATIAATFVAHAYTPESLAQALTYEFYPLSQGGRTGHSISNAKLRVSGLELAVKSEAKSFLMSAPIADAVELLWSGRAEPAPFRPDSSSHQRPRSPRRTETAIRRENKISSPKYAYIAQMLSAGLYLGLYIHMIQQNTSSTNYCVEALFDLWSVGYALEEYRQLTEFGPAMYFHSLWNLIDAILIFHFALYGIARIAALLLPSVFPRGFAIAHGVLIVAGVFVVPRIFSVFDYSKIFANMVFSLKRISPDFAVAWLVLMMFSLGVWVSVAFSVPRIDFGSAMARARGAVSTSERSLDDSNSSRGRRTALAMFKMLFGETGELWEYWWELTAFDRFALTFYLFLVQFIVPTVVTAVVASSFANLSHSSEEEFYYMRAVQTLIRLRSRRQQLPRQPQGVAVPPINVICLMFNWSSYFIPERVYSFASGRLWRVAHLPLIALAGISDWCSNYKKHRDRISQNQRQKGIDVEIRRSLGELDETADTVNSGWSRSLLHSRQRGTDRFALVNEAFTNEKLGLALSGSSNDTVSVAGAQGSATGSAHDLETEPTIDLSDRISRLEEASARIENMLLQLMDQRSR